MVSNRSFLVSAGKHRRRIFRIVAVLVVAGWVAVTAGPELTRDRIYPIGGALIAADGALFSTLLADLPAFVSEPTTWLWRYYEQYPALSVRRRPPLFAVAEGLVYLATGISVFGAKLTLLAFSVVFVVTAYFVSLRLWKNDVAALCTALLLATTPTINMFFRSLWLYVPSLALFMLAMLFYARRLVGRGTFLTTLVPLAVFSALTLYTYQPPFLLLVAMCLHLVWNERRTIMTDRALLLAGVVFLATMTPLLVYTFSVAPDNVRAIGGSIQPEWKEFADPDYSAYTPILGKASIENWTYYARMLIRMAPLQVAGLAMWLTLWLYRRPSAGEGFLILSFLVAYAGFSWMPAKAPGYGVYILLPLSMLAAPAFRDGLRWVSRDRGWNVDTSLLGLMLPLVLFQAFLGHEESSYYYASDMNKPVEAILSRRPLARVLYAGRFDAAFVFYLRAQDEDRRARVYRASVQVKRPADLSDFLEREGIDFIVYEAHNPETPLQIIDDFRVAIQEYLQSDGAFMFLGRFDVPYWGKKRHGHVVLEVFSRDESAIDPSGSTQPNHITGRDWLLSLAHIETYRGPLPASRSPRNGSAW